jgi:hypothetical protein
MKREANVGRAQDILSRDPSGARLGVPAPKVHRDVSGYLPGSIHAIAGAIGPGGLGFPYRGICLAFHREFGRFSRLGP